MAQLTLPQSVRDVRGAAVEALHNRVAQIDLSPLLVYNVPTVPAAALPFLAWQFDLLSPLWQYLAPAQSGVSAADAATSANRALIQSAIPLHAKRGTPYAIKTALANLGYPGATIQEGQASWGGATYPANQGWAVVRLQVPISSPTNSSQWAATINYPAGSMVVYNGLLFFAGALAIAGTVPQFDSVGDVENWDELTDTDDLVQAPWILLNVGAGYSVVPVGPGTVATIEALFAFFAPRRSWLDSIWFIAPPISDAISITDAEGIGTKDSLALADLVSVVMAPAIDPLTFTPAYGGTWQHSGFSYANQPVGLVDSAVTVNGTPEEGNK